MLVKQFRYPINAYVYEFPAGLVEPGEEMAQAGIREIYEETGLVFEPKVTEGAYTRPFFTTVGMTDESCGTIYATVVERQQTSTRKNQRISRLY